MTAARLHSSTAGQQYLRGDPWIINQRYEINIIHMLLWCVLSIRVVRAKNLRSDALPTKDPDLHSFPASPKKKTCGMHSNLRCCSRLQLQAVFSAVPACLLYCGRAIPVHRRWTLSRPEQIIPKPNRQCSLRYAGALQLIDTMRAKNEVLVSSLSPLPAVRME